MSCGGVAVRTTGSLRMPESSERITFASPLPSETPSGQTPVAKFSGSVVYAQRGLQTTSDHAVPATRLPELPTPQAIKRDHGEPQSGGKKDVGFLGSDTVSTQALQPTRNLTARTSPAPISPPLSPDSADPGPPPSGPGARCVLAPLKVGVN